MISNFWGIDSRMDSLFLGIGTALQETYISWMQTNMSCGPACFSSINPLPLSPSLPHLHNKSISKKKSGFEEELTQPVLHSRGWDKMYHICHLSAVADSKRGRHGEGFDFTICIIGVCDGGRGLERTLLLLGSNRRMRQECWYVYWETKWTVQ